MMELHTNIDYQDARYSYIFSEEAEPTDNGAIYVYADINGIAHIGIGINLEVHLEIILQEMGFDVSREALANNDSANTAEQAYIQEIRDAIAARFLSGSSVSNDTRTWLNEILFRRSTDAAYDGVTNLTRVTDFSLANSTVSRNVFEQLLEGYTNPATDEHVEGYEEKLDRFLERYGITSIPRFNDPLAQDLGSKERLALLSLGYTSAVYEGIDLPTLWGPGLRSALKIMIEQKPGLKFDMVLMLV